ncbi:EF-hand domain-containing protein [Streptomyces yaizuensis]|uniref:EF-hand domain-containing protein n=1 Tax=Streptomyces yaizuensis TaxID=2989713 RepID=A0ABQ5P8N1_9ACTN|nr:EF-hand domain-containing protein [Streptomyces sp. YSPA8]GLF98939.1 EF-hand domain-containing protein [Streptomyces sp. YSPA8]
MSERTVLDVKLDRSFDLLDTDGDGRIRASDLTVLASRLSAAFAATRPETVARLERAFTVLWTRDVRRMGTGGGDAVDREEWRRGVRRAVAEDRDGFLGRMGAMLQEWLDLCDADSDGGIGRTKFLTMYGRTLGLEPEQLHEAFTTLDIDGDGRLSREDIRGAVAEYYTSDATDTPGNWLFGPL